MVEQLIRNEKVGGSTPLSGTNIIKDLVSFWAKSFSLSELDVGNLSTSHAAVAWEVNTEGSDIGALAA